MEASYCKYYIIKSNLDINFYENIELMRVKGKQVKGGSRNHPHLVSFHLHSAAFDEKQTPHASLFQQEVSEIEIELEI